MWPLACTAAVIELGAICTSKSRRALSGIRTRTTELHVFIFLLGVFYAGNHVHG